MDMSSSTNGASDMDAWKPFLHTSLFSAFPDDPDAGEPFLFPTFRIYSRTTFLGACLFTFALALVERWLTFLLDTNLALQAPTQKAAESRAGTKRKHSDAAGSVYVHLPNGALDTRTPRGVGKMEILLCSTVYFAATLLRYVLMIISMGMDWMMLLSIVSGLTLGHLITDVRSVSARTAELSAEEVELLAGQDRLVFDQEGEGMQEIRVAERERFLGADGAHRRSGSRLTSPLATSY
ncbi:Ctr copper transporter [Kalmanozyma brasiliensis GHG001]|uniref:Ctr copper transporter n=1 Tax=Kalmanozyma brasiliensis (strain GHG001) TaxID=1365824 RepID=UPI0028683796|nr:Ctr copper transporter [Kalmanozyma brasiliensis GHG001]KAF6766958.1 Ctr copper transporter [Kalmanozyma brasiliensis GHG001]